MNFQKIVLSIAIVLLILTLVVFGIAMYNKKSHQSYPPVQSTCPDYWQEEQGEDNEQYCVNVKGLGDSNCDKRMNFNIPPFTGGASNILCQKEKWAKNCGITWDGVTNNTTSCKK